MRSLASSSALAALLALGVPAVAEEPAPAPAPEPQLAARVNGVGIPKAEFDRNWSYFLQKSGIPVNHADKGGGVEEFRRQVIDDLVGEELMAQEAVRLSYAATEEEVAAEVAAARAGFPGDAEFHEALAGSGLTAERLAQLYARRVGIEKYVAAEITARVEVTDAQVEAFYRENAAEFEQPERARARHILVEVGEGADEAARRAAREKAEGLLAKVRGGADFAELARESSDCPSAAEGGDLGVFARGQMVGPFDAAVFALAPGEVSGVVETPFGYHVVRVEERLPAGPVPLGEVAPQVREFLQARESRRAVAARIEELRAKSSVEILLGT